jgi:predicted transcriptional regulator
MTSSCDLVHDFLFQASIEMSWKIEDVETIFDQSIFYWHPSTVLVVIDVLSFLEVLIGPRVIISRIVKELSAFPHDISQAT